MSDERARLRAECAHLSDEQYQAVPAGVLRRLLDAADRAEQLETALDEHISDTLMKLSAERARAERLEAALRDLAAIVRSKCPLILHEAPTSVDLTLSARIDAALADPAPDAERAADKGA